jgi:hypothetical protein
LGRELTPSTRNFSVSVAVWEAPLQKKAKQESEPNVHCLVKSKNGENDGEKNEKNAKSATNM